MKEIKLKIADTVSECIKDVTGFPNITAGSKSLVGQLTPKLEVLFTAETAAMREALQDSYDALITRLESNILDEDYNGDFDFWDETVEKAHKHPTIQKLEQFDFINKRFK